MPSYACSDCKYELTSHRAEPCNSCVEMAEPGKFEPKEQPVAFIPNVNDAGNGGMKHDDGKVRLDLLPVEALTEIAKVLTFGANKYAAHNWRKGFVWSRTVAALLRHFYAWLRGEDNDPETGLSHMAHVGCNVLFLLTFILTKTGTDDRFKTEA